jgi:hypothetical protein
MLYRVDYPGLGFTGVLEHRGPSHARLGTGLG